MRLAVQVEGVVQGIGFRPFVHGAATRLGLTGWVRNGTEGVRIEVQGPSARVQAFLDTLRREAPPGARVARVLSSALPQRAHEDDFRIVPSERAARVRPTLPPDLATCPQCLAEIASPTERRFGYPFTNCTHCGPRYTILQRPPYDRANTTMRDLPLCEACAREYANPADRRFHAQPIACPACGPQLVATGADGAELARGTDALGRGAAALLAGRILALKGLGGYQLLVDATSSIAVARLRARKQRPEKPLAVMFPSLAAARRVCSLDAGEEHLLVSPEAPIVLARKQSASAQHVVDEVAPGNPWLGLMLPYTPLHQVLLSTVARPLVCTSGNLSEEPMCSEDEEARARLGAIADLFLAHDRAIVRPMDDSIARVGPLGPQLLRRARGYAPVAHPFPSGPCVLALGGSLKSTVALAQDGEVVVSQHIGDLSSPEGRRLLERVVADLLAFFQAAPEVIACDLHPDYPSTWLAEALATAWRVPLERVQHHHAHVAACVAEHQLAGPVLGLAWDGAGLGSDGTVWGGEALVVDGPSFRRVVQLRPFSLPGGERALREPRRAALGLVYEALGETAALTPLFADAEARVLARMIERRVQAPRTTSMGRLFDAIAALAGVRSAAGFEGQAAMALEFAAEGHDEPPYPLPLGRGQPALADWEPLVRAVLEDRARGVCPGTISARFHASLAQLAEEIAQRVGLARVILCGGCFQNLRLARAVSQRLMARGCQVYLPQYFPTNDGGLALGQAYVAALRLAEAHAGAPERTRKEAPCASASPVK